MTPHGSSVGSTGPPKTPSSGGSAATGAPNRRCRCGTGILAARIQAALQPDEVTGIDPSEGMLANARKLDGVDWLVGAAEICRGKRIRGCRNHLDGVSLFDQPAALAEFHRVLAPGGIVVVGSIIQPSARPRDLCGILARCTPAGYLATDTVPDLLTETGFRVVIQTASIPGRADGRCSIG